MQTERVIGTVPPTVSSAAPRAASRRRFGIGPSFLLLLIALGVGIAYWIALERDAAAVPSGIFWSSGVLGALEAPVAMTVEGTVVDIIAAPGTMVALGTPILSVKAANGSEAIVAAPHAGRIDRLAVKPGDKVEQGRIVAIVTDISKLTMIAPFLGSEGTVIAVGSQAQLQFKDFKPLSVPARVVSVVPHDGTGEPMTLTRPVTVTLEVTDTRSLALKPGLKGRVYVRAVEGAPWPARLR